MLVNHNQKVIIAYQWERLMVCNFFAHVLKGASGWSVKFLEPGEKQEDVLFDKQEAK